MKLIALQDFSWAHDHVRIVEYKAGEKIDTDDADLIRVAMEEEGWAAEDDGKQAPRAPSKKKGAPAQEAKEAGAAPENE